MAGLVENEGTYAMMALTGEARAAQPNMATPAARSLDRQLGDGQEYRALILIAVEGGQTALDRTQRALRRTLEGVACCPQCGDTVPCPADRLAPGGTCPHPDFEGGQESLPGAGEPNAAQSATLKAVRRLQDAALSPSVMAAVLMADDRPRFEVFGADGELLEVVTVLPSGGLLRGKPMPDDVVDAGVCCGATVALGDVAPEWAHGLTCVRRDGHEAPHRVEPATRDGSYFEWRTVEELEGMACKRRTAADAERRESAPAAGVVGPDLVSRMRDAEGPLKDVMNGLGREVVPELHRAIRGALRWLEVGIEEGLAWRLQRAAARELVLGEPHVCTCGDCEEAPFSDRCRFEMALRALVR